MGMRWESATLPDAVSPFLWVANSVTGVKTESDGLGFEISGKTAHLIRMKSEDLPFANRNACLRDYGHRQNDIHYYIIW